MRTDNMTKYYETHIGENHIQKQPVKKGNNKYYNIGKKLAEEIIEKIPIEKPMVCMGNTEVQNKF